MAGMFPAQPQNRCTKIEYTLIVSQIEEVSIFSFIKNYILANPDIICRNYLFRVIHNLKK